MIQTAATIPGGLHVADQYGQGAGQALVTVFLEKTLHGDKSRILIAVQQHGDKQGFAAAARQVNQGGPLQDPVQFVRRNFEYVGWHLP
jgi:hypothetical protein